MQKEEIDLMDRNQGFRASRTSDVFDASSMAKTSARIG